MDPKALQDFLEFVARNGENIAAWAGTPAADVPGSVQDAAATAERLHDAKWGALGIGHTDAPQEMGGLANWIKQAPNVTLGNLRETMGPLMGPSMGNRANVASGMGDLASRWAALALSSGPTDDPLSSYARFILNQQATPFPQTQL
jgi:hypothetical protein